MKITQDHLKKIIAEEVRSALTENTTGPQSRVDEFFAAVEGDLAAMSDPDTAMRAVEYLKMSVTPGQLTRAIERAVELVTSGEIERLRGEEKRGALPQRRGA